MYRLKGIILFLLICLSGVVSGKKMELEKQCGKYKYIIVINHAEVFYGSTIKHYYQENKDQKKLFHQSEKGMHVDASCTKDKKGTDVFVFTEICGGSGCIEDIYGLFDLEKKKLLLKPSDWPKGNENEVIKILGNPNFILYHQTYNFENPEFCCVSKLADYHRENKINYVEKDLGEWR